jgi:hypothetical protein
MAPYHILSSWCCYQRKRAFLDANYPRHKLAHGQPVDKTENYGGKGQLDAVASIQKFGPLFSSRRFAFDGDDMGFHEVKL